MYGPLVEHMQSVQGLSACSTWGEKSCDMWHEFAAGPGVTFQEDHGRMVP